MIRFLSLAFSSLLLFGCATTSVTPEVDMASAIEEIDKQKVAALKLRDERRERLLNVGYHLKKANMDLCPVTNKEAGYETASLSDFSRREREAARTGLGIDHRLTVLSVATDSPGEKAGLRKGDYLTAINGEDLKFDRAAAKRLNRVVKDGEAYTLTVFRDGEFLDMQIVPEPVCGYGIGLVSSDAVNAYADGNAVFVTTGMMRFIQDDAELALVVGHELGHNTMRHMRSKTTNILLGSLAGSVLGAALGAGAQVSSDLAEYGGQFGAAMFSQEFEAEADYVGVYYAGRAGYEVTEAAEIWRRMGIEHPSAIDLAGGSHPSTATRFLAIEEAAKEFSRKKSSGASLVPNSKKDKGE